jgi:hypothetical protein
MTITEIEDNLEGSGALLLEPRAMFDQALVGLAYRADGLMVLAYDSEKCIAQLMEHNDWDIESASEWYDFNVVGAYAGPGTPVFVDVLTIDEQEVSCA